MRKPITIGFINSFRIPGIHYPSSPKDELMDLKEPDTEIVVMDSSDSFIPFVEQAYEAELLGVQTARDAWKAEQAGDLDAICVSCSVDPGVKAARELCDTLVMSPACAVLHVASMLGRKFSYVTCGTEGEGEDEVNHVREILLATAQHYGLADKIASIRSVRTPPTGFNEALLSEEELATLKESALSEAKKAIFDDGAQVIIGYGGPRLHEYLVEQLRPLGVPVINPSLTLLKVTEMLVRLGLTQSKRTYPRPRQVYDFTLEQVRIERAYEPEPVSSATAN